jgi:hypothetical protein
MGTAQISDLLIYNGNVNPINTNPLEEFFQANPERKPQIGVISSANWRGYQATFEILDGKLFVKDITIETFKKVGNKTKSISVIDEVFPKKDDRFCSFYSGLLILPQGKLMSYAHLSYASLYEKYLIIGVFSGEVGSIKSFTSEEYTDFQMRQFEAYKKTKEYAENFVRLMKPDSVGDTALDSLELEKFMFEYNEEYSSKYLLEDFR